MSRLIPSPPLRRSVLALLAALLLAGCDFRVPLTAAPTRPVQAALLGDWVENTADKERDQLAIRRLDDATYVVVLNGDAYRAFHSDLGDDAFVSVQNLNDDERKFCWYRWSLSADGAQLTLEGVDDGTVPDEATDPAAAQRLLAAKRGAPGWLEEPVRFVRAKREFR
jgi:hypothetical protein